MLEFRKCRRAAKAVRKPSREYRKGPGSVNVDRSAADASLPRLFGFDHGWSAYHALTGGTAWLDDTSLDDTSHGDESPGHEGSVNTRLRNGRALHGAGILASFVFGSSFQIDAVVTSVRICPATRRIEVRALGPVPVRLDPVFGWALHSAGPIVCPG